MNNDQASSGAFFIIGLAIAFGAVRYKLGTFSAPDSGLMPFLVGTAISLLAGIGFVHATLGKRKGVGWTPLLEKLRWERVLIVLAALVAYILLVKTLGFLICTALFIGFLLKAVVPQRWPTVFAVSLITALASYGIFELWLKAQLPRGIF
ncbi:MAG: tripartite tricarboxylate transporter TctB family protein [Deltaproteobacteria bacterium]|nr:MAG: tripartite tricarboxylate transporter TctB family protein [Deltaproteobacteria bacterium]